MEKHEARVKCPGCGSSYKLKVPATDKPVNFKCKKCGKVLKIKVAAPQSSADNEIASGTLPGLETTQLPDTNDFFDTPAPAAVRPAPAPPKRPQQQPGKTNGVAGAPTSRGSAPPPADHADEIAFENDFGEIEGPPSFDDHIDPDLPTFDPDRMFEQREKQQRMQKESAIIAQKEAMELAQEKTQRQAQAALDADQISRLAEEAQAREKGIREKQPTIQQGYADHLRPPTVTPQHPGAAAGPYGGDQGSFAEGDRRWLVLDEEQVRGPFTDEEIKAMIQDGEINSETPLRLGQRPWIKAAQISDFKTAFGLDKREKPRRRKRPVEEVEIDVDELSEQGPPFYEQFPTIAPYPIKEGKWQPLAIFGGIAFILCTLLSLDFLIGLPLCIAGWIFLYGYLDTLMSQSLQASSTAPPAWDFADAKRMLTNGGQVFLVLLVYCLIPLSVFLLLMITFFLNGMDELGYVFMFLTVVVYAASLFVTPASLALLALTKNLGVSLHPARVIVLVKNGKTPYHMLAATTVAVGMVGMVVVLLAVFLVDIPLAGFVVAGLAMAAVLSYANFIWFHILGRFCRENAKLVRQLFTPAKA